MYDPKAFTFMCFWLITTACPLGDTEPDARYGEPKRRWIFWDTAVHLRGMTHAFCPLVVGYHSRFCGQDTKVHKTLELKLPTSVTGEIGLVYLWPFVAATKVFNLRQAIHRRAFLQAGSDAAHRSVAAFAKGRQQES